MPGFMIGGQGQGPSATMETLRDYRWLITRLGPMNREVLKIARDVTLPDYKVDVLEVLGTFLYYKFAKSVKWDDVSITFYDNGQVLGEMYKWRDMVFDNLSGIKVHTPGQGYKRDAEIQLLDGKGSALNTITLKNAWPKSVSQGKLTMASTKIKQITIILAYDYAEVSIDGSMQVTSPDSK